MNVKGNYDPWLFINKEMFYWELRVPLGRCFYSSELLILPWVLTHQSEDNEEDLNDVSVSHRDEASQQSVAQSYHCGHDDWHLLVQVQDDLESGAWNSNKNNKFSSVRLTTDCILPRAPRMEADQKISDIAAGRAWMAPQRPYFCKITQWRSLPRSRCSLTWVKGSIIVTYSAFLMGLAKNVPPKVDDEKSEITERVRDTHW